MIFDVIYKDGYPTFPDSDGKDYLNFTKKKEGKLCLMEIKEVQNKKSLDAHKYFVGVVCPCVAHAKFQIGDKSKAQFLSFTSSDCIDITRQTFFVKEDLGNGDKLFYSLKVKDWGEADWAFKVQSIIDALQVDYDYQVPESDKKHGRHFLTRLKEQVRRFE